MGRGSVLWRAVFSLGVGIFPAVFLCNHLFASGLVNVLETYRFFHRIFIQIPGGQAKLAARVLILRAAQTFLIALCLHGRRKQLFLVLLPMIFGAWEAAQLVLFTWRFGALGLFSFLARCFPHEPFFVGVWALLMVRAGARYEVHPRAFYSALLILFCAGCLLEILVNPWFLHFL